MNTELIQELGICVGAVKYFNPELHEDLSKLWRKALKDIDNFEDSKTQEIESLKREIEKLESVADEYVSEPHEINQKEHLENMYDILKLLNDGKFYEAAGNLQTLLASEGVLFPNEVGKYG